MICCLGYGGPLRDGVELWGCYMVTSNGLKSGFLIEKNSNGNGSAGWVAFAVV